MQDPAVEAPGCANCTKTCEKPLRCGVCRTTTYCSGQCQKEDWRFHKRNCKKPAEPEAPQKKPKASSLDLLDGVDEESEALESMKKMEKENPAMLEQVKKMMGVGSDFQKLPTADEKLAEEPPKQSCNNCAQACEKPLRCGVCKVANYCTTKCQKEDWQFHKRICKKPDAPQKSSTANSEKNEEQQNQEPVRPKASESMKIENEDVGKHYNHRDWKPSEPKKDFVPTKVDSVESKATGSASEWNAAGTWEEKTMLPWWRNKLRSLMSFKLDKFGGTSRFLRVEKVSEAVGEANVMHIRGTPRFFFDLKFDVEFCYGYPTSSRTCAGVVKVIEFTHELAASEDPFPVQVTASTDSDKSMVEAELVPKIQSALREYIAEYGTQVTKRGDGKFAGQLPPAAGYSK